MAMQSKTVFLNRISYGATTGDIERINQLGLETYLDKQLNPSDDDPSVSTKLSSYQFTVQVKPNPKATVQAVVNTPAEKPNSANEATAQTETRALTSLEKTGPELWALFAQKDELPPVELYLPTLEIQAASCLRAAYSDWQLKEVMCQFWHNHFNVDARSKQQIALMFPIYDREVIRKHCLGNFRKFIEAVGKSTAMMYYLDNVVSKASPANENYARELFELHTLGRENYLNELYNHWKEVPGATSSNPIGYIDEDVYEAARSFTGWTIANGANKGKGNLAFKDTGEFFYYDAWHDNYQKRVLANEFEPNQAPMVDGNKVYDLLASHPGTASHICKKLCTRFYGENYPKSLHENVTAVWIKNQFNDNQIAEVLKVLLLSEPLRNDPPQKLKNPFELLCSFIRLSNINFDPNPGLVGYLSSMGYRLHTWPTPNGHPDSNEHWQGTNMTLGRWNLSNRLIFAEIKRAMNPEVLASQMPDNIDSFADVGNYWLSRMNLADISSDSKKQLLRFLSNGNDIQQKFMRNDQKHISKLNEFVALLGASPDFQLR